MRTAHLRKAEMHLVYGIACKTIGNIQVAHQHLGLLACHLFGRAEDTLLGKRHIRACEQKGEYE